MSDSETSSTLDELLAEKNLVEELMISVMSRFEERVDELRHRFEAGDGSHLRPDVSLDELESQLKTVTGKVLAVKRQIREAKKASQAPPPEPPAKKLSN